MFLPRFARGHGEVAQRVVRIQAHGHADVFRQGDEALETEAADRRVGHQDVVCDSRHDLGLVHGCDRQAVRAAPELLSGKLRRLVRLDVRAQPDSVLRCVLRHPVEIGRHPVEIDDGGRGLDVLQKRHYLALTLLPFTLKSAMWTSRL